MRKPGRKILSALLALALLVSVLPLGAAPAQAEGLTIEINSGSDLLYFIRDLGSGNKGYANANVVLTADIDVGNFFPIGYYAPQSPVVPFTGTFDGNGHTISGNLVGIDNEGFSVHKVGIIAVLGSAGIVKNLNVTCSVSGRVHGNVGGIVGENNGGTITNCTFSGSVSGIGDNIGGIVGLNSGSVTDCTNSGGVSGNGNVGGIVGNNSGSVTNCTNDVDFGLSGSGNFGGVVGNNSGTVENCSNSGSFSGPAPGSDTSVGNLGGIVGQNGDEDSGGGTVTNCYNTGKLLYNFPIAPFSGNLGGVVGSNFNNSSVTNCYSTGNIGSNNTPAFGNFGGVVGSNSGNSSVTNCYSVGGFGSFINSTVGGVVGNNGATVTGCYFLQRDNVPAQGIGNDNTHTGATPVSDLTDPEQFSDWDFDNIWRISQSLGFPVLQENAQDGLPPGLGTAESPYEISTADELKNFRDLVNGENGNPAAHAKLMNDIDLNPEFTFDAEGNYSGPEGEKPQEWTPIGNDAHQYTGTFNGNGKTIENLYINSSDNYQGLFGYVDQGGTVQNLGVSGSVTVTGGTSNVYEGGIVGENSGGRVENCAFSGNVSATGGYSYVGGVVGDNSGIVQNCYNTGKVTGSGSGSMSGIGGVVGFNNSGATIQNCYNTGRVANIASGSYTVYVGGVVGNNFDNASVTNCYFLQTADVNKDLQGIGINIGSGDATAKDGTQFASGEVAWRLQNGQTAGSGQVWGQNLSTEDFPVLTSDPAKTVHQVTVVYGDYDNAPTTESFYTNDPAEPSETPTRDGYTFDSWKTTEEGNTVTYTAQWKENAPEPEPEPDPTPTPTPDPEPTPEGPSTEGSAGWEDIAGEIEDAEEGDQITIDMGDETKVPAEIFESVAGKDVDVTFDLGDVQWTVNGADIPADADLSDLDLGVALDTDGIPVNVINTITGEIGTVQITLAHDGEFGFTMTLSAPLGEENAGYWANLYHYDEEAEALQFEAAAEIDEDGNVKIPFSHASQYAIVIDDHSHAAVDVSEIFVDVAPNAWYKDAVQYAYDNGLMTGVSDTEFAPEATTTRAMIVSILARLENVTSAESAGFADVDDEWYATAVNWAASVGVVNGYEDNTFRPNTAITREQLAAILMNYSAYKGEDVSARADLSSYTDQPSAWAEEAMSWAVAEKLISGVTNTELQPQGNATRAQVAAILQRFLCK